MPTTADTPKCFAEVAGQRILDWTLDAFRANGVTDFCFIGGYQIDKVREAYPEFTFRLNDQWPDNNILASLFYAEDLMDEAFCCCYSDILFSPSAVQKVLASEEDITLVVDTAWDIRYEQRTQHPPDDAEKVTVENGLVTSVDRRIPVEQAYGEYIGLAKFSAAGGERLKEHYHRCREEYSGRPFREAPSFQKAYKIHLLQEMIEAGERMAHVDTPGGYIEIDTQQDFQYARQRWIDQHLGR